MPPSVASDSTSSDIPTFEQAAAAAVEEHSKRAPAAEEHADDADESTQDEETEDAEGKAAAEAKPAPTKAAKTDTTETGLISDEEFSALQTKHANDPVKLKKALDTVFTQKMQAIAEERKGHERLKTYESIIDAYETDPEAALRALAEDAGFTLAAKGPAPETTATKEATSAAATDAAEAIMQEFRESLGPELEYLAEGGLGKAVMGLVERLTKTTAEAVVKPIQERLQADDARAVETRTQDVLKEFGTKHPDWKDHEQAMLALGLEPARGVSEVDHLEHLYQLATLKVSEKDRTAQIAAGVEAGVKAALAKMKKGAEGGEHTRSTPEARVAARPAGVPTWEESIEAAKRGERFD